MAEIILQDVYKEIRHNTVVNHVSFEVKPHTIVGLKGINGSGKTMIMRLMAGLIYPTSGTITIDGKHLGKDMAFPTDLGLMLENPSFLGKYSGYDNLRILADINGKISEGDIQSIMKRVGLEDSGMKKYRKFSLGMKQRLGIAAAVMENPDILILDEPTISLDEDGVSMVKELICQENQKGTTIVLSCHDSELLNSICDKVICLNNGSVTDTYTLERNKE